MLEYKYFLKIILVTLLLIFGSLLIIFGSGMISHPFYLALVLFIVSLLFGYFMRENWFIVILPPLATVGMLANFLNTQDSFLYKCIYVFKGTYKVILVYLLINIVAGLLGNFIKKKLIDKE